VLHNSSDAVIAVGGLGPMTFNRGYYLYIGSGMNNLFRRIDRHRRTLKKKHWHIDYLSERFRVTAALPIVTEERIECALARSVGALGYQCVDTFGSSDCACPGHLYYGESNPLYDEKFIDMVYEYRFGGLKRR
jgi:sugar fermentation stimulation protein A